MSPYVGSCDPMVVEVGIHLPQLDFGTAPMSIERISAVVDAARDLGFAPVSANDHFTFSRAWLDGLTLLAVVAERAGALDLVTSIGRPSLRGPVRALRSSDGHSRHPEPGAGDN